MTPSCPNCKSSNLDQGIDEKILCHGCGSFWVLVKPELVDSNSLTR